MSSLPLADIGRSFLAILAGFATMTLLITAATATMTRFFPGLAGRKDQPPVRHLLLNLAYSALFAACGGYVTAVVAKDPLRNVLMLAIVVLLMSGLSALQLRGQQSLSYQFCLIVLMPIAALAGGLLRIHFATRIGLRF